MMKDYRSNSRRFCCFKGCLTDRAQTKGNLSFFTFPVKDTERCSKWISNSGREEFRYLTPKELAEKRICELHFNRSMFSNVFKTHLKKNAFPYLWDYNNTDFIQIDDDDDNDDDEEVSNDCESGIVSEGSSNNIVVTPTIDECTMGDITNDKALNKPISTNGSILSTVLTNGNSVLSNKKSVDECPPTQGLSSKKQLETTASSAEKVLSNRTVSKNIIKNTKFHNLPPQMTGAEFYYQQCPSAEETTNSYPEPPDGELPLFVQQSSVHSVAEETANSDASEPVSKKRKRDKDSDDLAEQMRDAMKHLKNITALLTNTEDEFELFGKSVAVQLKKMSLCTALTVQAKVQQLLSEYRINDIKKIEKSATESVLSKSAKLVEKDSDRKSESDHEEEEDKEDCNGEDEDEETDNLEQTTSPQLSLTCASETSDIETTDVG